MGHFEDYLHSAALKIRKRYRGWKGRKDFSRICNRIVKVQSQFLLPLSLVSGWSVCISISSIQFIGCKCLCGLLICKQNVHFVAAVVVNKRLGCGLVNGSFKFWLVLTLKFQSFPCFWILISASKGEEKSSDKLGLSLELGSFAAGVMIATTDLAQHTLEQIEPIRNLFAALFLASIGMLIHVHFLWNHVDILVASVILVIVIKTIIIASVVKGFGYNNKTSVLVGMSLAQIGEFAFVLLSRASNLHLVEGKLYLLLLGTTALSLVTTPLLFKLIPAVVHLGVLLRWFSPDSSLEIGYSKVDILRSESGKQRIILMDQESHDS